MIPDDESSDSAVFSDKSEALQRPKLKGAQTMKRQRALNKIPNNALLLQPIGTPKRARDGTEGNRIVLKASTSIRQTPARGAKKSSSSRLKEALEKENDVEKTEEKSSSSRLKEALKEDVFAEGSAEKDQSDSEESYHVSDDEETFIDIETWEKPPAARRKERSKSPLEELVARTPKATSRKAVKQEKKSPQQDEREVSAIPAPNKSSSLGIFKLPPLLKPKQTQSVSRPSSSSDNDRAAILTYNPPRSRSPAKAPPPVSRPRTPSPPPSPSRFKSTLTSPSKLASHRIPPTPGHRPSLDDFWSQSVINQWNDQYSPKKIITSPRKQRYITPDSDDKDFPSPSASPRKSPSKRSASPRKKDRRAIEAKKAFEAKKHSLAEQFLKELDDRITAGKIGQLASTTGGVKLIWSKKLNSTAGRANWRRETTTKTQLTSGAIERTYRHHASIELAEKVIDDENRLINVLAHEFCHLANFMVSGIKDNPHGKEFKAWARKVSDAFGESRGVEVTTKHSYQIDYKYVWECGECGHEYKRHSKSVDPARHVCSTCKGKLVQTKPVPRAGGKAKASEYQVFVKENFQRAKRENPGKGHGTVMEILGAMYRERKAKGTGTRDAREETSVEMLTKELEVIALED
jgi:predicted SprT family Zn-dependent metalloprotease